VPLECSLSSVPRRTAEVASKDTVHDTILWNTLTGMIG
jgi:hypothetical protein